MNIETDKVHGLIAIVNYSMALTSTSLRETCGSRCRKGQWANRMGRRELGSWGRRGSSTPFLPVTLCLGALIL